MEESRTELREGQPTEIIDVLSTKHQFHWEKMDKIPTILSNGLPSNKFAEDFDDRSLRHSWPLSRSEARNAYLLTSHFNVVYGATMEDLDQMVAIAIRENTELFYPGRVASTQFAGFVVIDTAVAHPFSRNPFLGREKLPESQAQDIRQRVDRVRDLVEANVTQSDTTPVYGTSGDMYWPQHMSHEEIVQMLKGREAE